MNTFACLVLVVIGLGLVALSQRMKRQITEARRWPSTTGRLSSIEVETTGTRDSVRKHYRLRMRFTYTVGNLELEGNEHNIDFTGKNQTFNTRREAEAAAARWKATSEFPVYIDPACPDVCVLLQEKGSNHLPWLMLGCGFLIFGVGFMFIPG